MFLTYLEMADISGCMKTEIKKLIKKYGGSKQEAADNLLVTVRYIDMILNGRKPSKRLVKMVKILLST